MNKQLIAVAVAAGLSAPAYAQTTDGNWQASLIFEGLYVDKELKENEMHGMPAGGHNHGLRDGLQWGHNEVVVTGDITDSVSARFTTAITQEAEEEGNGLELEVEEAFIEASGIGNGFNVKAGRFYSDVGYLSSKHNHEWDFADQPLIYEGMFGEHPTGDGLQLSYVAPTDTFLKFGGELFADEKFPSGETDNTISAGTVYAKVGGDIGTSHSWLAGVGHWRANDIQRTGEAHDHGGGGGHAEIPRFSGDSKINTIGGIYKWAPNGNARERNFKFQAEYFKRDENGRIDMLDDGDVEETSTYNGDQSGWYAQAVYQFRPHWRVGLRHDRVNIENTGSDDDVLEEAGLHAEGHKPTRNSLMLDYSPKEYSRWRLQYSRDERSENPDDVIMLQYTHSFGSHGAHAF